MLVIQYHVVPCYTMLYPAVVVQDAYSHASQVQPPLGYFDPLGISKDGDFTELEACFLRSETLSNGKLHKAEGARWTQYAKPSEHSTGSTAVERLRLRMAELPCMQP